MRTWALRSWALRLGGCCHSLAYAWNEEQVTSHLPHSLVSLPSPQNGKNWRHSTYLMEVFWEPKKCQVGKKFGRVLVESSLSLQSRAEGVQASSPKGQRILSLWDEYLLQGSRSLFANRNCRILAKSKKYKEQIITWMREACWNESLLGTRFGWQIGPKISTVNQLIGSCREMDSARLWWFTVSTTHPAHSRDSNDAC